MLQAIVKGDIEEIQLITNADPSQLESRDATGHTPLHIAAGEGQLTILEFLLSRAVGRENFENALNNYHFQYISIWIRSMHNAQCDILDVHVTICPCSRWSPGIRARFQQLWISV